MSDCIFCKIINGQIPTDFLHDDQVCVAFRDINPKDNTHLLLVPKKHINSIAEMEDEDSKIVGDLFLTAKKVANKLNLKGYNLQINVGKEGGQEVFHLHVHLMSKFS